MSRGCQVVGYVGIAGRAVPRHWILAGSTHGISQIFCANRPISMIFGALNSMDLCASDWLLRYVS